MGCRCEARLAGSGRLHPPGGSHRRPGHWTGQSYKQVKDELGRAYFQVSSDLAIRRHQALVNCAVSFCWDAWFHDHPAPHQSAAPRPGPGRGEREAARRRPAAGAVLATGTARGPRLAFPLDRAAALVAGMVDGAPAPQLQSLIDSVAAGYGLHFYIRN